MKFVLNKFKIKYVTKILNSKKNITHFQLKMIDVYNECDCPDSDQILTIVLIQPGQEYDITDIPLKITSYDDELNLSIVEVNTRLVFNLVF